MIKKKDALPNTQIIFDKDPMIRLGWHIPKEAVKSLPMFKETGKVDEFGWTAKELSVMPRTVATIKSKPHKYKDGGTIIELNIDGESVWMFWVDVYHNATVVGSGDKK